MSLGPILVCLIVTTGESPDRCTVMRYSVRTSRDARTEACTMTKDTARMTRAGSLRGESADEEVTRLRGCLNDLVGITALPALWTGGEPSQIAGTLLDALLETLRLAFVLIRFTDTEWERAPR